jgi:hypothetical protein
VTTIASSSFWWALAALPGTGALLDSASPLGVAAGESESACAASGEIGASTTAAVANNMERIIEIPDRKGRAVA